MKFEDNSAKVKAEMEAVTLKILEMWGMIFEKAAKKACPVGTPESTGKPGYRGGTLRNSITYEVQKDQKAVAVGSNVEYAPHVELGTGPYFEPPPEWEQFDTPAPSGLGHSYVTSRPFLRTGILDNTDKAKRIAEAEYKKG